VYPSNRISLLAETLHGLRLQGEATVVLSCVTTLLVEAGSTEPQESRLPEVFQVLKDFSTIVLGYCEESALPGLKVSPFNVHCFPSVF
jgi:hypothetical protein